MVAHTRQEQAWATTIRQLCIHRKEITVASEFKLPELGENIHAGDVVRIAVTAGENVKEGQTILELETDKAVVEVPSTVSGVIESILVAPSQQVKVGDVVFTYSAAEAAAEPPKESTAPARAETKTKAAARAAAPASAATEFRLPELGENIEAGDVVRVAVAAGEELSEGQTVLELETDKAVVEVPSTIGGTVQEVKVKIGERVKVGDVVLTVAADGAPAKAAEPEAAAEPQPEHTSDQSYMAMTRHSFRSARTAEGKSEEQALPPDVPPEFEAERHPVGLEKHAGPEHRTVPAAPIVRKLARDIGVDIYLVKGTGPGGRISEADVKAFAKGVFARMADEGAQLRVAPGASAAAVVRLPDFSRWGAVEKVSLRGVRRKTAEHLALAWNVIPHVTQHDKADVTELEELRKRFAPKAEKAGGKMTMTAIALKVVASALKAFPQFNSSIDTAREEIVYKRYVNIGVAVDTDRGLLVPVIRNVDKKNIIELAVELTSASAKAREKKLTAEDMEGGSFTITNLGGIGGTAFTPIVNHPEVAILGMSRSRFEPVWMNNKFEPRMMLPLSLSYDHRIIDGADAARFTRWIVDALEQPFLLSVQG
jgi:pyruvate dehydrogenase E2 component (dihydrolipoamide acetyltransferase)